MKHLLIVLLIALTSTHSNGQAELFQPSLISDDGAFGFTLSPDGNTALFVRSKGKRDTLIIMESRRVGGQWTKPVLASFSSNGQWKDIDPMFAPGGKTVYFQSNRAVPSTPGRSGFDIWAVTKEKHGWSAPYHLGSAVNSDVSESYASVTRTGTIYFTYENGVDPGDIHFSRYVDGKFQQPESLGAPINTSGRDSNPFIGPNEDYIIYVSTDSTGFGDSDLYISFRTSNGWSTPQNLGPDINTKDAEFCPFYHQKQQRLYFTRMKRGTPRLIENIYSIPVDLQDYKPAVTAPK